MPATAEHVADLAMVVELPDLNRPDGLVLVRQRLVAAVDIHDAEAPDTQADSSLREQATIVRASVGHDVSHTEERVGSNRFARRSAHLDDAANPAHDSTDAIGIHSRRAGSFVETNS